MTLSSTVHLLLRRISIAPFGEWFHETRLVLADALADCGDEREEKVRGLQLEGPEADEKAVPCSLKSRVSISSETIYRPWRITGAPGPTTGESMSRLTPYGVAERARDDLLQLFPEVLFLRMVLERVEVIGGPLAPYHWIVYGQVLHQRTRDESSDTPDTIGVARHWIERELDRGQLRDVVNRLRVNTGRDSVQGKVDVVWPEEASELLGLPLPGEIVRGDEDGLPRGIAL